MTIDQGLAFAIPDAAVFRPQRAAPLAAPRLPNVAIVGNSLPRLCGIATFTTDLQLALAQSPRVGKASIVAMTDPLQSYDYPPTVELAVAEERRPDYAMAARVLNAARVDAVSLQHEFGIFGGDDGEWIVDLVEALHPPLITTLHTVLSCPTQRQRRVIERISAASAKVIVMAEKGARILAGSYDIEPRKIDVIPHGIPDMPLICAESMKAKMGFAGRTVVLTFGLLSPNKGIEVMIDAMPAVSAGCPDALYIVLGATHPHLLRDNGEAYRDSLAARAAELGVGANVLFINRFVDRPELLDYIAMCDVYVTPYLSKSQLTSGTLAYSFGLGRPIVSTPYWHAAELLRGDRGVLVPFADPVATGQAVAELLGDPVRRAAIGQRSYAEGRAMTWEQTAEHYVDAFAEAAAPQSAQFEAAPCRTVA